MPQPKRKPPAKPATDAKIEVILDVIEPKKHSVKALTEAEGQPFSNVYIKTSAYAALGRPGRLKVTIEPAE